MTPDRFALTREERLEVMRRRDPVPPALRKLDQSCPDCGRQESFTGGCSWCFLAIDPSEAHRASEIAWETRAAAVRRHGWRSDRLCPELRQNPARTLLAATEAGKAGFFPPAPSREPQDRSEAA